MDVGDMSAWSPIGTKWRTALRATTIISFGNSWRTLSSLESGMVRQASALSGKRLLRTRSAHRAFSAVNLIASG
jgi:hypothetical protein